MRTTTKTPFLLALLLAAGPVACARVEADVPDMAVTRHDLSFQGVPGSHQAGEVSITQSFPLDSSDLSWAKNLNSDVYAYEVELRGVGDTQDLSFIHYAHISMSDGASDATTTPVELVEYERPANYVASPVITAPTLSPVNVSSVWKSDKVVLTLVLAGIFPEQGWQADVTIHMSGKVSYKF
jgi:hypothetical protein